MSQKFMVEKLAASGLLPADLEATVANEPFSNTVVGFRIPYNFIDGTPHPHQHRIRLEHPGPGQGKYTQPSTDELVRAGHPAEHATMPYLNRVLIAPGTWDVIAQATGKRLLIVEGEIKAAAVMKLLGIPAVGIAGCDSGCRRDDKGIMRVHPMIAALLHRGDTAEIVLDGDLTTNPGVNRAAGTLKRALWRLGVNVVFRMLPVPPPGQGAGLDDFLMAIPAPDMRAAFDALPQHNGDGFNEDRASLCDWLGLMMSDTGKPVPNASNVKIIIEKHEHFRRRYYFDVMRCNLYRDGSPPEPLADAMITEEQCWIQEKLLPTIGRQTVADGISAIATNPKYQRNLLLASLPAWDGQKRLETMFINGWGADDNDYVRAVGENWLTSALARAMNPGCKVDTVLVLIGRQGLGKSRSLATLGGSYYIETHEQTNSKDFILALHRGWIIDMAELGSMNHSVVEQIKGIISTPIDNMRPPYARVNEEMKRHSIIVGTTNEDRFLHDRTGNRRFWPIECSKIDIPWIEANQGQLYAEARERVLTIGKWWVMPASTAGHQERRVELHPWDDAVGRALHGNKVRTITINGVAWRFVSCEDLFSDVVELPNRRPYHNSELRSAVSRVGGGLWKAYQWSQRDASGAVRNTYGYRAPAAGVTTGTVIDMPPRATNTF